MVLKIFAIFSIIMVSFFAYADCGAGNPPPHNYSPYTPQKLDNLSANYAENLVDIRYGRLTFNNESWLLNKVHYTDDTARTLIALAEEEQWTPITRLSMVEILTKGLIEKGKYPNVTVPQWYFRHDSAYEINRIVDAKVETGKTYAHGWLLQTNQVESHEGVGFIGVEILKGGVTYTISQLQYQDGSIGGQNPQRYQRTYFGHGQVIIDAKAWKGDQDRATEFSLSASDCEEYTWVMDRLHDSETSMWFNFWMNPASGRASRVVMADGSTYNCIANSNLILSSPTSKYLYLIGEYFESGTICTLSKALLIVWTGQPQRIIITGNDQYSTVKIVYSIANPEAKIWTLPIDGADKGDCAYLHAFGNSISTNNGIIGIGEWDPTRNNASWNSAQGGLAAGAYVLQKYNSSYSNIALQEAEAALDGYISQESRGVYAYYIYHVIAGAQYLMSLGEPYTTKYRPIIRQWGDRLLARQNSFGSWNWLDDTLQSMKAIKRVYYATGDAKYQDSVNKALTCLDVQQGNLRWRKPDGQWEAVSADNNWFMVARWMGGFAYCDTSKLQMIMDYYSPEYVHDYGLGCWASSDLNPYFFGNASGRDTSWFSNKYILSSSAYPLYYPDGSVILTYQNLFYNPYAPTPNFTRTNTPTRTPTPTNTPSHTQASTALPTSTNTKTNTRTPTDTPTIIYTHTITNTPSPSSTPKVCNKGDVNCDGNIIPGDALLVFQIYLRLVEPTGNELCDVLCSADYTLDDSITSGDSLCIFREYLRNPC